MSEEKRQIILILQKRLLDLLQYQLIIHYISDFIAQHRHPAAPFKSYSSIKHHHDHHHDHHIQLHSKIPLCCPHHHGTISAPTIPQTNKDCFSEKTMLETAVYYYIVESCSFNSECAVGTTWGWLIGN